MVGPPPAREPVVAARAVAGPQVPFGPGREPVARRVEGGQLVGEPRGASLLWVDRAAAGHAADGLQPVM